MTIRLLTSDFKEYLRQFNYKKNGDTYEINFGHTVVDVFSNSELYWQLFVIPMTNRIDNSIVIDKIGARKSISIDIYELSRLNYSVFINLVFAKQCISNKQISFFENFYTHIGTVCDLAEEFVTQLYFIKLICEQRETEILQKLSKTEFLEIAEEWYDKYYSSAYEHYLSKGKTAPIKLISRANILDEYYSNALEWKEYSKFALQIRTYRNVVVHNPQIGGHIIDGKMYVPKKGEISNYKKWYQIFAIDANSNKFKRDFIEREYQMVEDLRVLKEKLNNLWIKPIDDFNQLLYIDKNQTLLKKYDLHFEN
jgi:hypothetical protein